MKTGLYREQELSFRTQYAELKERTLAAGKLLPGSPGTMALRSGTGYGYWYRVYYAVPKKQWEDLICKEGDVAALAEMRDRIAFSDWVDSQVSLLKKLGFQAADKNTARVLVELHNVDAFRAGLVLVGSLAYMAWLNELGAIAVASRTEDLDLARGHPLRFGVPLPFMKTLTATGLPFVTIPGLPSHAPATSVKLRGIQGLRVDLLAPGKEIGQAVRVPELDWSAATVPYYDYLLANPEPGSMLAGGHCVPVRLSQAARFVWHKLYSSTQRKGFPEKAAKDRQQALVLGSVLAEHDSSSLKRAYQDAPSAMTAHIKPLANQLADRARSHPAWVDLLRESLGGHLK